MCACVRVCVCACVRVAQPKPRPHEAQLPQIAVKAVAGRTTHRRAGWQRPRPIVLRRNHTVMTIARRGEVPRRSKTTPSHTFPGDVSAGRCTGRAQQREDGGGGGGGDHGEGSERERETDGNQKKKTRTHTRAPSRARLGIESRLGEAAKARQTLGSKHQQGGVKGWDGLAAARVL